MRRVLVVILSVLVALLGRQIWEGKKSFQQGEECETNGQLEKAIGSYDQSIHWYFPGNPYVQKSLERLIAMSQELEKKDPKLALLALDSARGGIYGIRSFYSPYHEILPEINEKIATLRAREQIRLRPKDSFKEAKALHLSLLQVDLRPSVGWSVWVGILFLAWVSSVIGWILKGFDSQGVMHFRSGIIWIVAMVLSFSGWILGLIKA